MPAIATGIPGVAAAVGLRMKAGPVDKVIRRTGDGTLSEVAKRILSDRVPVPQRPRVLSLQRLAHLGEPIAA